MDLQELARSVEAALRAELGLSEGRLQMVRQCSNVVFVDRAAGVVARVANRSVCERIPTGEFLRELQDLAGSGVPVAPPLIPEVIRLPDARLMTVWPLLRSATGVSSEEVAAVLSELHESSIDVDVPLFSLSELAPDYERLEAAAVELNVSDEAVAAARERTEPSWRWLMDHPPTHDWVIAHRDPYPDNMAYDTAGRLVWIDLDTLCVGPRELDLEKLIKLARRFGDSFPAASDEAMLFSAYRHAYDPDLLRSLNVVGDFDDTLGAFDVWECVPNEYNRIRAVQRISTLSDPQARWLPF